MYGLERALWDGFHMTFVTQLQQKHQPLVESLLLSHLLLSVTPVTIDVNVGLLGFSGDGAWQFELNAGELHSLLERLLPVRQARVGQALFRRRIRTERAARCQTSLMAAAEVPPPGRARELRDLDALDVCAAEVRELLCGSEASGSMGCSVLEKAFAPKRPEAQCAKGLMRRWLMAEREAPGAAHSAIIVFREHISPGRNAPLS